MNTLVCKYSNRPVHYCGSTSSRNRSNTSYSRQQFDRDNLRLRCMLMSYSSESFSHALGQASSAVAAPVPRATSTNIAVLKIVWGPFE